MYKKAQNTIEYLLFFGALVLAFAMIIRFGSNKKVAVVYDTLGDTLSGYVNRDNSGDLTSIDISDGREE